MALTSDEINSLVQECAPLLIGARVDNVYQDGEYSVFVTFYSPVAGKLTLLLATRPHLQRFCLIDERPLAPTSPPFFCEAARGALRGGRLERCRQVSGDRIVELTVSRPGEAGESDTVTLVLEMMGQRGQLVLVNSRRCVLASLHSFRRGGVEIVPGAAYRFPEPRAQPPQIKALGSTPWRYVDEGDAPPQQCPAPLSFVIARRHARLEAAAVLSERRERLVLTLRRQVAHTQELAAKVQADLQAAEAGREYLEKGELLKGALGRIKRGMKEIELENYFVEGLPRVRIELNDAVSPLENLQRYFKRYQKTRRAQPFLRERLARFEAQLSKARELLLAVEAAPGLAELELVESEAQGFQKKRTAQRSKGPKQMAALGPRRFTSMQGFEVLVGRNARQNDELTLRTARGNDIFLHVAGRPGGHVIIRSVEGKQVPLETLIDGAHLAVYYSLPERQRGAAALHAGGEVDYTQVKHIRKPKGARPGLVLLSTHKTLRVRLESERLERLQHTARDRGGD